MLASANPTRLDERRTLSSSPPASGTVSIQVDASKEDFALDDADTAR